jgi:tetratricopeptide (TPR) repeat protein
VAAPLPPLVPPATPGPDAAATEKARALWAAGDYDAALAAFRQAVKRNPTGVTALVNLARAHGFLRDYGRAEESVRKLLAAWPHDSVAHTEAGETYRLLGLYHEAAACFDRACALAPTPKRRLDLADVLERLHQVERAADLARAAVADDPSQAAAWLLLARLRRRQGDMSGAEASLRRVLELSPDGPELAPEAWAELGLLLDQRGEYDAAWEAVGRGKRLQLARDAAERRTAEHVLARFARLVDDVTPDHFRRWHAAAARFPPRPCALLTGFPRTGTTLLEQVLDAHPSLVSSEEKDVLANDTFPAIGRGLPADAPIDPVLDALTDDAIGRHRADYFRKLEGMLRRPIGDRVHLDKNPAMTLFIPVMVRLFPECKLLIALRDPRDVVLSCYLRYLPLNPVSVSFLTVERTAKRYTLDMLAWLKYRAQLVTPWAEFRYEDTVADLPAAARKALDLLGLPWDDRVLAYRERLRLKPVLSPTYEAVTKPVYATAIGRWRNYVKHLEPVLPELEPYAKEFGYE